MSRVYHDRCDDEEELLAFYDYPAEHWVHLRTTNPIESTFATVRHRTKITKGPGSKAAGLALAYKLRPSGLFISTYFDTDDRLEAIEFGRPHDTSDAVTYDGRDAFTTPAADLIAHLQRHTPVLQQENGHAFTAYDLLLSFWRPVTPDSPDDEQGRFFDSVLIAQPGYYNNPAEAERPGRK